MEKEDITLTDEHAINREILMDLIIVRRALCIAPVILIIALLQASLGAEESSYDQYAAFKIFETFPEVRVLDVVHVQSYMCLHVFMLMFTCI